jgi:hypothetical protein
MCPTRACGESSGARGTTARLFVSMLSLLATWIDGPVVVWWMLVQCGSEAASRKCLVAPVSTMAVWLAVFVLGGLEWDLRVF